MLLLLKCATYYIRSSFTTYHFLANSTVFPNSVRAQPSAFHATPPTSITRAFLAIALQPLPRVYRTVLPLAVAPQAAAPQRVRVRVRVSNRQLLTFQISVSADSWSIAQAAPSLLDLRQRLEYSGYPLTKLHSKIVKFGGTEITKCPDFAPASVKKKFRLVRDRQSLEDSLHIFVHYPFFQDLRDEYLELLFRL